MKQATTKKRRSNNDSHSSLRTTIALQKIVKEKLGCSKAPGQSYDGFINELVEYWERYRISSSLCSPGKPIRQAMER
jgi:hypothetical protein